MKKNKKKIKINSKLFIAVVVLIIAILGIIIFATKAVKSSRNKKDEVTNLLFSFYSDDMLVSKLNVEYKNSKVNDVKVTMIYSDHNIAKEIANIYKDEGEYSDISVDGKNLIMHYNEKEVNKLANLSQKEIIERFELQGYKYQNS